jgi:ABC-type lipoprotein release transport system permease subunit
LLGLFAALPVARLLQRLFSGVDPLDPLVYSGMAALLATVGIAASRGPALRAARTNPAITLQAE